MSVWLPPSPVNVSFPFVAVKLPLTTAPPERPSKSFGSPVPVKGAGGVTTIASVAPSIVMVIVCVVPSALCTVKLSIRNMPVASAFTVALALLSV